MQAPEPASTTYTGLTPWTCAALDEVKFLGKIKLWHLPSAAVQRQPNALPGNQTHLALRPSDGSIGPLGQELMAGVGRQRSGRFEVSSRDKRTFTMVMLTATAA